MPPRFTPTVRQLRPLIRPGARQTTKPRRLAAAAAIASAAIAATPSIASADTVSTCSYDPTFHRVTVQDRSGFADLRLTRGEGFANVALMVADGSGTTRFCNGPGATATIANTDKIIVQAAPAHAQDRFVIDQSKGAFAPGFVAENDGNSEIEVTLVTPSSTVKPAVQVNGTSGPDTIKVGADNSVLLGTDGDVDVSWSTATGGHQSASFVVVDGGQGADFLSGRGGSPSSFPAPASVLLFLNGGSGNDILVDGGKAGDNLSGDSDQDILFSADGNPQDVVDGGPGIDSATIDATDTPDDDIEDLSTVAVGRLHLSPAVSKATAGEITHVKMSWTHPKAWKALRSISWRLMKDKRVAEITIRPASGRLSAHGAARLASGSHVTHKGKTVTATLNLRLPKVLAGEHLRVDVEATDRKGHRQLEPSAGLIHITK
jgi:hypothetical protein